jgi:ribosomal protein L29|tara:strand:+ start:146 stop:349 length:204 start_codon:yes stop_codon:yes gene_type:complete
MSYLSSREIDGLNVDQRKSRLVELREEMLQLRAQQALGGSSSDSGSYKATRRSIARLLSKMNEDSKE